MKAFLIVVGIVIALFVIGTCSGVVSKWTNNTVNNSVESYEEYQNLYNTCSKLNTDLGNMQAADLSDRMFENFSKAQRILTIKTNLNRWVEDYNAKSKMINKSLWKSSKLPYQLTVDEFSNYNK